MSIKLTEEQRNALSDDSEAPVEVVDESGRRYYLISEAAYRKMREWLESEEIAPSFYEFEDSDRHQ